MSRPKQRTQRTQRRKKLHKKGPKSRAQRRKAGMPVGLGLTPKNPKHRAPSRITNNSSKTRKSPPKPYIPPPSAPPLPIEFPMFKKSKGKQLLNSMESRMSSAEQRELANRVKTLQLKKDLGLVNVQKM